MADSDAFGAYHFCPTCRPQFSEKATRAAREMKAALLAAGKDPYDAENESRIFGRKIIIKNAGNQFAEEVRRCNRCRCLIASDRKSCWCETCEKDVKKDREKEEERRRQGERDTSDIKRRYGL